MVFVPGDETVIRGLEQAVLAGGNMRVGGTRRALIPPKASVSWPYVRSGETDADEDATGARTRSVWRRRTTRRWGFKRR